MSRRIIGIINTEIWQTGICRKFSFRTVKRCLSAATNKIKEAGEQVADMVTEVDAALGELAEELEP